MAHLRWLFFQDTVWNMVDMMNSPDRPVPYIHAETVSHWSSERKYNTELPRRLGMIQNWTEDNINMYLLYLLKLLIINCVCVCVCVCVWVCVCACLSQEWEGWVPIKNKSTCSWVSHDQEVKMWSYRLNILQINIFLVLILLWTQEHVD